jgi:putative radical SAM enzyme (TIGR03279 family)
VSTAVTLVSVQPGSAAADAGLCIGDEILSVDGVVPRDLIEWRFATDEPEFEIELRRGGLVTTRTVERQPGQPFGAEVSSAVFDRVRTCDNHCEFCFIYQLPKGMRRSLYLKDDDYRLSFLYGNFTTLTRFTEADLERVVTERLSPLHVSIHATDHEVRSRMLKNPRGGMSLRWLRALLDHGIAVRGQVVLCPGINDGAVFDRTMAGILDEYPELDSVAVVPLGLSRFNSESAMRLHTTAEAEAMVDAIHDWQDVFVRTLGRRMVFAADEYYLMAGRPFPSADAYEGFGMHEDGIGMARTFEQEFLGLSDTTTGTRSGFFAAVDAGAPAGNSPAPALPANPAAYTGLRHRAPAADQPAAAAVTLLPRRSAPIGVLTGRLGAEVLAPLCASLGRADVRIVTVDNDFFGGNTGVAGLMVGDDVRRALARQPAGHRYLLPDVCLNDGRFLDGLTVADLPHPVEVVGTDGRALRAALQPQVSGVSEASAASAARLVGPSSHVRGVAQREQ